MHHKIAITLKDTCTMVSRSMKHTTRHIDIIIMTAILPLIQLLLFVLVFSGAMNTGDTTYLDYILPGILLLGIGSCASMTAVSVKEDIETGIVNRFRTMDISQSSVLNGHMVSTLVRCGITISIIMIVSFLLGFRTSMGAFEFIQLLILIILFTISYTWIAILWGIVCPSVEGVGAFTYLGMFLPYMSSCFVPISSMSPALQPFAKYQPFTPLAESIRGLFLGNDFGNHYLVAIIWCIAIFIIAYGSSIKIYKNQSK